MLATDVFAMDRAAGGGVLYNLGISRGIIKGSYETGGYYDGYYTVPSETVSYEEPWTMSRNGFGAFGFLGLGRAFELNVGFMYKNPNQMTYKVDGETIKEDVTGLDGTSALQLGLYWKHPIPLNAQFVFFPTLGVDFELTLSDAELWWNDLWLRGGVGLDTFLSDTMFLRSHLIYGAAIPLGGDDYMGLKTGHGLLLKVGLGFMF